MDVRLEERYRSRAGAAAYARKYSRSWTRRLSNWRELSLVTRAVARAGRAERLLDCPCGAGRLVPVLARSARQVTALDFSSGMLDEARRALAPLAPPVEFVQGSLFALPFPDREFDVAVCHRLIHHLSGEERATALAELFRVSRRSVILSFANAETARARRRQRRGKTSCAVLSEAQLAAEGKALGLDIELPVLRKPFSMLSIAVLRVREPRPR